MPPTRAAMYRLLNSRCPWGRFFREYSSSRWIGATFMVSEVNSTLSISVTVRVKACLTSMPSTNSSKYRPRMRVSSLGRTGSDAAVQRGERVHTGQPRGRLVGVRLVDVDVAVHDGTETGGLGVLVRLEQAAVEVDVLGCRRVDAVDHRDVRRVQHDLAPEPHPTTVDGERLQPVEVADALPERGQRMDAGRARGEQDPGAVVPGLEALRRPLVADRDGDVGVLGRGADQRTDARRGQGDLLAVLDALDGLDRQDVLDAGSAVAPLEVLDEGVVLGDVDGRTHLGREHAGQPGDDGRLEVGPRLAGVQCVGAHEQADLGVLLRQPADGVPDGLAGGVLLRGRDRVLQVEAEAVRTGGDGLVEPGRLVARYGDDGAVGQHAIHTSSASLNWGLRFSRKAVAPSTMSSLPMAWTSIPSPLANESREAFHQMLELTLAISR